jgi:hypothetical protein
VRLFADAAGPAASPVRVRLAEAETRWPTDRAAAAQAYEASLAAARDAAPADLAEVVVSYGTALLVAGDVARATTVAGQAAQWAGEDFACAVLQARLYLALRQPEAFAHALAGARALAGERPLPDELIAASAQLR